MSYRTKRRPRQIQNLVAGQDNTSAINSALAAAKPEDTIKLPPGEWTHSSTLSIPASVSRFTFDGYGSVLRATVPRYAGLHVQANDITLAGITHNVDWGITTPARGTGENTDDAPFCGDNIKNLTIKDCVATGARDVAFFMFGVNGLEAENLTARDSLADGFHMTYGTANVFVKGLTVVRPGDDGLAVVSYVNDPTPCQHVHVHDAKIISGDARGASIVGGTDIHYWDIDVERSREAAIYIAQEQGTFNSTPVSGCSACGGDIYDANWDSSVDNGSIGLFTMVSGAIMQDVLVSGFRVQDRKGSTYGRPYLRLGNTNGAGGKMKNVVIEDLEMRGGTQVGIIGADGTSSGTVTDGAFSYLTLTGTGTTAITDGTTISGATNLTDATTTTSAPGVTVRRIRATGQWVSPNTDLVVLQSGASYPARPAGVPAGMVTYQGSAAPGDSQVGDRWLQTP